MKSFEQLGEEVRAGLEQGSSPAALADQKRRLLAGIGQTSATGAPGPRWGLRLAVAAGVGLLVVAVLVWAPWRPALGPSCLRDDGLPVHAGDWLSTGTDQRLSLRFSDKSQVRIQPSTNLWVADLAADRVRLSLQTGRLELEVEPRTGRTWRIQGGPYQVEVIGTRFSVEWSPDEQDLDVSVERGAVKVRGGQLGNREIIVRAGENLRSRLGDDRVATWTRSSKRPAAPPTPAPEASAAPEPTDPGPKSEAVAVASRPEPKTPPPVAAQQEARPAPDASVEVASLQPAEPAPEAPNWQQLASGGRFDEALRLAQEQGIDEVLAHSPAQELLLLADAARLARHSDVARQALLAVRTRFPAGPTRSQAAIRLGRLEAAEGAFQASARWLSQYLSESPHGRWVGEARGRLLEAWMELGQGERAKRVAQDVLRYDGDGPYRQTAERILGVEPPK